MTTRPIPCAIGLVLGMALLVPCPAADNSRTWTDPALAAEEHPDFLVQGEYNGKGNAFQVVALGNGNFHAARYRGGRRFTMPVHWQARQSTPGDLAVFLHFKSPRSDRDDEIAFQADHTPATHRESQQFGAEGLVHGQTVRADDQETLPIARLSSRSFIVMASISSMSRGAARLSSMTRCRSPPRRSRLRERA